MLISRVIELKINLHKYIYFSQNMQQMRLDLKLTI